MNATWHGAGIDGIIEDARISNVSLSLNRRFSIPDDSHPHANAMIPQSPYPLNVYKTQNPEPQPRAKRFSWFRSSKRSHTLLIRSPMTKGAETTDPNWHSDTLLCRLKLVFVGSGACGKTCLLKLVTSMTCLNLANLGQCTYQWHVPQSVCTYGLRNLPLRLPNRWAAH